ncbi:aldo/keto reductase [Clavulina sp. PMI_390]|nr:aldo/keto reductase [Clavulina sp. PMI_390]
MSPPMEDELAFAAIKASLDHAGPGEKVLLNSADYYGSDPQTANVELASRFFEQNPDYVDKALLCIKVSTPLRGAQNPQRQPDSSPENIRKSVANIQRILGNHKSLDIFEPARLDHNHTVEEVVTTLKQLQNEGILKYIGLSEVAPIATVEMEVSPWTYDENIREVIAAAGELGVTVLAYSPIGRGFLTGNITPETLDANSVMRRFPRFSDEAMVENKKIVDIISALAQKKGISNAQLCIAWVSSLGDHVVPLPGSTNVSRTVENFAANKIVFTPAEKKEIDQAVMSFQAVGDRYPTAHMAYLNQ